MRTAQTKIFPITMVVVIMSAVMLLSSPTSHAASLNPFSKDFKLSVCDGPAMPNQPSNYVPCDFYGLMKQAQHLMNAMIILGILFAVVSFTWAGVLLIWSGPEKKSDAKKIFEKTFWGLIMMLVAWFIVWQILDWLSASSGVKTLLGNP